ncbi:IucA/IucC family protein [Streptomyces sp. NPDC089919]|uniref:IucA/IucC family protein n=1 Tax=Streptomyces sp. NPDC089919 TaxID=3155188 RepID=UPI00341B2C57
MFQTGAERALADELRSVRPDRLSAYEAALPGARAAVLARLWRGLVYDPLPWTGRRAATADGGTAVHLADGRRISGPAADPWATGDLTGPLELAGRAYGHPAELLLALGVPRGAQFAEELAGSVACLALARTAPLPHGAPRTSWEWEQRVVDGHPYHPGCRSRPGFDAAEQLAYAPEQGQSVRLPLVAVTDPQLSGAWPKELREDGTVLVPVHPWQAAHVLDRPTRGPELTAHPLMALRTLAADPAGPLGDLHVKTALSARLTSSVRDISAYSVANAGVLSEFVSELVQKLPARWAGRLHITRTVAAVGAPAPDLAAVLRESPDRYADASAGESVVPVAALGALVPAAGRTAWLVSYAELVLGVGLGLLGLGVALEAHGQNLLLVVDSAGRPLRLVYRDLADIRISPARLARHGIAVPELTARQQTDEPEALRRKLFGSLVTGALGPLAGDARTLGEVLTAATRELPPGEDLRALLTEPLPAKALTLMRLSPPGTGDRWARLPNPLTSP